MNVLNPTAYSAESHFKANDRIFKLEIIDGTKPKSSIGLVDSRLFKDGEDATRLHLKYEGDSGLWAFAYNKGNIPPALTSKFTGVRQARQFAETYFANRNIRIVEVKS